MRVRKVMSLSRQLRTRVVLFCSRRRVGHHLWPRDRGCGNCPSINNLIVSRSGFPRKKDACAANIIRTAVFYVSAALLEPRTPSAHRGTSTDKITVTVEHPNEQDYTTQLTTEGEEHRVEAAKGEGGSTYTVCFQSFQPTGRSTRVEVREGIRRPCSFFYYGCCRV